MSNTQQYSGMPASIPLPGRAGTNPNAMRTGTGTTLNLVNPSPNLPQYNQMRTTSANTPPISMGGPYPPMTVMGMPPPPRMSMPTQPSAVMSRTSSSSGAPSVTGSSASGAVSGVGGPNAPGSIPSGIRTSGTTSGLGSGSSTLPSTPSSNGTAPGPQFMYDGINGRVDLRSSDGLPVLQKGSYSASIPTEFTMHSEDFPALPGYKGTALSNDSVSSQQSSSSLANDFQDGVKSMMGAASAYYGHSNYSLKNAGDGSLSDLNNGASKVDMPSKGRMGTDTKPKPPAIAPPSSFSSAVGSSTANQTTATSQTSAADRFGLLGLLGVIRMTEQDLNTLAIGSDLTTLGLNLNSPESLYATFASPWADGPGRRDPDYRLPQCYYITPPSPLLKIASFSDETLFYIFYVMPRDQLQEAAAQQLYNRNWRFHKERKIWLTRDPSTELTEKTDLYERGTYIYFDVNAWEKIRKEFTLRYDMLEERSNVSTTSSGSTPSTSSSMSASGSPATPQSTTQPAGPSSVSSSTSSSSSSSAGNQPTSKLNSTQ